MTEVQVSERRAAVGGRRINQRMIPNVPVLTHDGTQALFYDDLVRDRVVLVSFMSIKSQASYPVIPNLVELVGLLGPRLGRDLFLYSITLDPLRDDVAALARFARRYGAKAPGWRFITGDAMALSHLRSSFFVHRGRPPQAGDVSREEFLAFARDQLGSNGEQSFCSQPGDAGRDCALGLMRYGNDALDIWGSAPAKADPAAIVERLSWISGRRGRARSASLKRGGPWPAS